jgi:phosphoribosylformylglycinamidine cyclo-ligase
VTETAALSENAATNAYAAAGVDIHAADSAIEMFKSAVARTKRPEVIGGLGGFAGLFDASALKGYAKPILATSTDGVGTKVAVAQAMDKHDTIGFDLVGMVVDDLVVCGAEPLFMTDYICTGKVDPQVITDIVTGIANACVEAGVALVGGEIAEHPGLLKAGEYDVAGATTGVVEADSMLGADRVQAGDVVLAMASSGLHSNGYSLVRHVLLNQAKIDLGTHFDDLGHTLGEELLVPTRIYTKACLELARTTGIHAMSHVTGGGLAANLERVLPNTVGVEIDRGTWTPAPIFDLVRRTGDVSLADLEMTLNCGVGMVALLPEADVDKAIASLATYGIPAWVAGRVTETAGGVVNLSGAYKGWA